MDWIEATLRGIQIVAMVFVASGFGALGCEAIERATEAMERMNG